MIDAERLPTVPVPRYLSIHWGWLLFLSLVEEALQAGFHWDWLGWANVLWVWGFVQAVWLIRVDHRSRALFWYGGAALLGIVDSLLSIWKPDLFPGAWHPGQFPKGHAFIVLIVIWILIGGGISITGTFVFRAEMRRFFHERDNPGMQLSPWMTFFFNVLYFQFYFHDIAEAQKGGLSITHASA